MPSAQTDQEHPPKFVGTYRIANWDKLENRSLYHFFYLHPGGRFLLAAEWPGRESSRATGSWRMLDGLMTLIGTVRVDTNQGHWRTEFQRSFHVEVDKRGIGLKPIPRKNRYGLLGWPNAYIHFRTTPAPNLPSGEIPSDQGNVLAMIRFLSEGSQGK